MNTSTSVTFSKQTNQYDGLIMEQEEWDDGVGYATRIDLVTELSSALYGTDSSEIDCGVTDGAYNSLLYVFPFDPELLYQVGVTHGSLGSQTIQDVSVVELVHFSLRDIGSLKYPVQEVISEKWAGDTWDEEGGVVSKPTITITGNDIELSSKVYGTVEVEYWTVRHTYGLTVPAREDMVDTAFQSVAYAYWDGSAKLLELEPPTGAEDDNADDVTCGYRSQLVVTGDDDPPSVPSGDANSEIIEINYCSGEEISV